MTGDTPWRRPDVPWFDELPEIPGLGVRSSWEVFGPDDNFGTLNFLDGEAVGRGLSEGRRGERIGLSVNPELIDPPLYGREPLNHSYLQGDRNTWDDRLDSFYPQGASQWDGLRHVRCREFGFYTGLTLDPPNLGGRLGIDHWARTGIIGRGVLIDVEAFALAHGRSFDAFESLSVSPDLLEEAARWEGVAVGRGDIVCVRLGWLSRYRSLDATGRIEYAASPLPSFAGLAADESMARYLWNRQVAAVACDNPGAEVSPGSAEVGSLHRRLIPALGFAVGEMLDFDQLAVRCAEERRWEFLFVAVPLLIAGGVGSPANAVAVR